MPIVGAEPTIRVALDINVLVADLLAGMRGRRGTAAATLVNMVRRGTCPAGPLQLITSLPVIENYANVLRRHFDYDAADADEKAWILQQYALEGPAPNAPYVTVGAGYIPFETEEELRRSIVAHASRKDTDKLFHEIQDDRYVLETALAGRADILATGDMQGFAKGPAVSFQRDDVILFPFAGRDLVIATPQFVVHWLSQGIVPNAAFIAGHAGDFTSSGRRAGQR